MRTRNLIIGAAALILILGAFTLFSGDDDNEEEVYAEAQQGLFEVRVFTTGELEAKNSIEIQGPGGLRTVGIWRVQISDIVDEGTVVNKGDYIASLDRTEISNKMKDANSELQQTESKFLQTKIDTTLEMRQARENLVNLEYQFREKKITLEQSQYEPPATIRQAEIELEKAQNSLVEAKENYKLKQQQSEAKMQEVSATLQQVVNKMEILQQVMGEFKVLAPEEGMVIYKRSWDGKKRGIGAEITPWNSVVATLPDLSIMISKTYVNEVDIRKIEKGQDVEINLDAFPDKKLTGKVISVANVGEQLKNADANVFEVKIQVNETDTTLRPAMTTGNSIVADRQEDVVFIPLEALHSEKDSISFVYMKSGFSMIKQEVEVGEMNDNFVVIKAGVVSGDKVLLSKPEDESAELVRIADSSS